MSFKRNPKMKTILVYSPTAGYNDVSVEEYYEEVCRTVNFKLDDSNMFALGDLSTYLNNENA